MVADVGLLVVRLVLAVTLMGHGQLNVFRWYGDLRRRRGAPPAGASAPTAPPARDGGHHPPGIGPLIGPAELAAAVLLTLGALTPVGAALVVGVAAVAGRRAYRRAGVGFLVGDHEHGFLVAAAVVSTVVAVTGPGAVSLDRAVGIERSGPVPGVVALAFGLVGAAAVLGGEGRLEDPLDHRRRRHR